MYPYCNIAWRDLPGHRHCKLLIGRPCKKRTDNLLKFSRPQLKMIVAILMGHAPVRKHLYVMGLFDGDPTCRFCRMEAETVQHIICCCEVLARQHYNVFGRLIAEPKDTSTTSIRYLCLFIRGTGLPNLCWMKCLRLHNKPMAEVRLEHMPTGPKEELHEEEEGSVWTGGKSRPTGIRSLDRSARSQSLYRLSYPAHRNLCSKRKSLSPLSRHVIRKPCVKNYYWTLRQCNRARFGTRTRSTKR